MKARNYGDRYSGGDAYAMGEALNEEIAHAWLLLWHYVSTNPGAYHEWDGWDDYASECIRHLRPLLAIRRAARGNAIREVVG